MLNQVTVMGRLTADPELRQTNSGTAVSSFTVACDRDVKNQSGEYEADFIDCVAWKETAEHIAKFFRKGNKILVTGRLQIRKWVSNTGENRRTTEVVVARSYFCESRKTTPGESKFREIENDIELPF